MTPLLGTVDGSGNIVEPSFSTHGVLVPPPPPPGPTGNEALVTALGGDGEVDVFYDVRAGRTVATGISQWADWRTGFGIPATQATASKQPALLGSSDADYEISFDGVDDFLFTAASALFDNSGAATLIYIGTVNHTGGDGRYPLYTGDATTFARVMALKAEGSTQLKNAAKAAAATDSVASSASRRLIILTQNATTGFALEIPNRAKVTNTGTDQVAGNNVLTIGALWTSGVAHCPAKVRSIIRLKHEITAGEITELKTWAATYHPYVAAS